MKPNGFGISVDQLANDRALWPDYILMLFGHTGSTHAIRKAAETLDSFDDAVDYLSELQLITPCFFIVSGL